MKTKMKTRNALGGFMAGLLLLAGSAATAPVQVNLVQNGSFENPQGNFTGTDGGPYYFYGFVSPGFFAPWVNAGIPMYAMRSRAGAWVAQDGNQYVEVDSGYAGFYQQTLTTVPGKTYTLQFWYAANKDVANANDDAMRVRWGGGQVDIVNETSIAPGSLGWTVHTYTVTATGTSTVLRFEDAGIGFPFTGGFLDNVSVVLAESPPTVSFPSAAAPVFHCTSLDGATTNVTINVGDADNDALTVKWSVNGIVVATHNLAPGATSDTLVNQLFGFAPSTLSVSVSDGIAPPVVISTPVTVADHEQPAPDVAFLPTITGECAASITNAPTATDDCDFGVPPGNIIGTTTDPLTYTAQGTNIVTWKYTDPHNAAVFTLQQQTVIVKDVTPPVISCPPAVSVAYGSVPAAATNVAGFLAQGGTIADNCDPNGTVTSYDSEGGYCPTVITRTYVVTDAAENGSSCTQIITVNNLFAVDGIVWHQPLARSGLSEDTDPSAGGTLKYRFKLGSTIPIKVHAQGCNGDVTANANVSGKVVVFGDTDMDGVIDANEAAMLIDYNGVGEAGGVMDKVDGHLKYNLDTKKLVQTFKCYILQVTITDNSTGETRVETVPLQAK